MKLFISWSGEFSQEVAERLSVWIPSIIQSVDVFYSPADIAKGENWGNRLSEELEQSNFGIVCLTPENVSAPWIHFEAGALSKTANSRVSAIMLGINPSDVKGPLSRLQNTAFDREDFYRLFQSINNSSEKPLKPEILKNVFENSWGNLEHDINAIVKKYSTTSPTPAPQKDDRHNSDSDALQEILRLVRHLDDMRNTSTSFSNHTLNDSSNASDYNKVSVTLLCPDKDIDHVLPLIRKYIRQEKTAKLNEMMLREYGATVFGIPEHLVAPFEQELSAVAPAAQVMP